MTELTTTQTTALTEDHIPRVHYFCLASSDELNDRYGVRLPTGAATNKVWGVASALSAADIAPIIVTGAIPASPGRLRSEHLVIAGTPVVRIFTTGPRYTRRVIAMASFAIYALRHVRAQDEVLLYNFYWDYFLAAALLRLAVRPAMLDVEDGPRDDQSGIRGWASRLAYVLFRRLCRDRVLTVSHALAARLNLPQALPVYGAIPAHRFPQAHLRLHTLPVTVLYGGSIAPETGLDLFIGAVERLQREAPSRFIFHVTGHIDDRAAARLARLPVTIHRDLSQRDYADLLASADIGLSLKLESNALGQTTFPSKVVEITSNGLLLVTTRVSDIPSLFNAGNAVLLDEDTPSALARALLSVVGDLPKARAIARAGQAFALSEFSLNAVGMRLRAFILGSDR